MFEENWDDPNPTPPLLCPPQTKVRAPRKRRQRSRNNIQDDSIEKERSKDDINNKEISRNNRQKGSADKKRNSKPIMPKKYNDCSQEKFSESKEGNGKPFVPNKYDEGSWRNHNEMELPRGNFFQKRKNKVENSSLLRGPSHSVKFFIEDGKTGKLIGKEGANIKSLQENSGAGIKVGKPCADNNSLREIVITGETENVCLECKELIEGFLGGPAKIKEPTKKEVSEQDSVPFIDWDRVNQIADKAEKEKWANCTEIVKNFYIEHPEVSSMTDEEVAQFRKEKNNIMVTKVFGGSDRTVKPVKTFEHAFERYPEIMNLIKEQKFETPSPIQCQAWPILLSGEDLIGIAQTGTGKTLAFILPAFIHIEGQIVPRAMREGPTALVMAPTRELALQIEKEVQKYYYKGIKSVCVYGGADRREQSKAVKKGVEIIIGTPGRVNDLVQSGEINLNSVTYVVLDEADRMLDMGFEPQIRKTLLDIRPDRQSVMTSATWPPNIQRLAERYMCNPTQVIIGSLDLATVHSVTQKIVVVRQHEKKDYLMDFIKGLKEVDKVIVFVSRKITADRLSSDLAFNYIVCECIHGDRDQQDREQALEYFRMGEVKILIATDVVSRGIDISDVTKVFNYDFPTKIEEYVHRVGRTGRAGKEGEAVTLFTNNDGAYAEELITILEEAEQPVPVSLYKIMDRYKEDDGRKKPGQRSRGWEERHRNVINY